MTSGVVRKRILVLLLAALVSLLAGCSVMGYYGQAVQGHLDLLSRARPVAELLQDPATEPGLRERLELVQRLLAFATSELDLPAGPTYLRYADLGRSAALWNVVAAPADSLELRRSCFVLVGCVGYRGYYRKAAAETEADRLRSESFEVLVYGVPIYSTLGWLDWLGGDPLLSTVIFRPDAELAGLLFHELAHRVFFARGDIEFNEAYATAVQRLGVERWLRRAGVAAQSQEEWQQQHRRAFRDLVLRARGELQRVYAAPHADPQSRQRMLAEKEGIMQRFRGEFQVLRQHWEQEGQSDHRFDEWVRTANNASFAIHAAYDALVPEFERLLQQTGGDWARFHAAARALALLPPTERRARLQERAAPGRSAPSSARPGGAGLPTSASRQ